MSGVSVQQAAEPSFDIGDLIACPGCLKTFQDPRQLPCCRVTLCRPCLNAADLPASGRCPRCRSQLPDGAAAAGPDGIPADARAAALVALMTRPLAPPSPLLMSSPSLSTPPPIASCCSCEFVACGLSAVAGRLAPGSGLALCQRHLDAEIERLRHQLAAEAEAAEAEAADTGELAQLEAKISKEMSNHIKTCCPLQELLDSAAAELRRISQCRTKPMADKLDRIGTHRKGISDLVGRLRDAVSAAGDADDELDKAVKLASMLSLVRAESLQLKPAAADELELGRYNLEPGKLGALAKAISDFTWRACGIRLEATACVVEQDPPPPPKKQGINAGISTSSLKSQFASVRLSQPPQSLAVAAPGLHPHVECDFCGQNPIQGTRHKCRLCAKFDLCQACLDKRPAVHRHADFAAISPSSESGVAVHLRIKCDGCSAYPIIGPRFKCGQCPDYDLCFKCYLSPSVLAAHCTGRLKFARVAA